MKVYTVSKGERCEGGGMYIVVTAFDTNTGLEIPWD